MQSSSNADTTTVFCFFWCVCVCVCEGGGRSVGGGGGGVNGPPICLHSVTQAAKRDNLTTDTASSIGTEGVISLRSPPFQPGAVGQRDPACGKMIAIIIIWGRVCVCVYVCVCARARRVSEAMCVCVCERDRDRERGGGKREERRERYGEK